MQLTPLEAAWPQAVRAAARWVQDAREQSLRVYRTPEGVNRRLELTTANSMIGQARGALAILRVMRPEDPELEDLWQQLNHCLVIMYAGDDSAPATRQSRPLQLVK